MKFRNLITLIVIIFFASTLIGTTWEEPWQEEILLKADTFIKGKVISSDSQEGAEIRVIETYSKDTLPDIIRIKGFYLLEIMSWTGGHDDDFYRFKKDTEYFFILKSSANCYELPTPTSGSAYIEDGTVYTSYRHEFHRAAVSIDDYILSYNAIWHKYRKQEFEFNPIINFINSQLDLKPADVEKEEMDVFFRQHVALETAYHLGLKLDPLKLIPFLKADFHAKASAVRALKNNKDEKATKMLIDFIDAADVEDEFCKVLAVRSLEGRELTKFNKRLREIYDNADAEADVPGFSGNGIMDPRCATYICNAKYSLGELLGVSSSLE